MHRSLIVILFAALDTSGHQNPLASNFMDLLQANNVVAGSNSTEDCDYMNVAVKSWLLTTSKVNAPFAVGGGHSDDSYVVWAQLLPVRCDWQDSEGVITTCLWGSNFPSEICSVWNDTRPLSTEQATTSYFANKLGLRAGELVEFDRWDPGNGPEVDSNPFYVRGIFDESHTVAVA
jgi:hypothetical protein